MHGKEKLEDHTSIDYHKSFMQQFKKKPLKFNLLPTQPQDNVVTFDNQQQRFTATTLEEKKNQHPKVLALEPKVNVTKTPNLGLFDELFEALLKVQLNMTLDQVVNLVPIFKYDLISR